MTARRKFTAEQERQICDEYSAGQSLSQVGRHWSASVDLVHSILKRGGVARRKQGNRPKLSEAEELEVCRMYQEDLCSSVVIGCRYKISSSCVLNILRRRNVAVRLISTAVSMARGGALDHGPRITELYAQGQTAQEIADELGKTRASVYGVLKKMGIERRAGNTRLNGESRTLIKELYEQGHSAPAIAQSLGVVNQTIYNALELMSVERTNQSIAGDSIAAAARGEGRFRVPRKTTLYIVELNGFPGFIKIGIAFDYKSRKYNAGGTYGRLVYSRLHETRESAYIAEQVFLSRTRNLATCPETLSQAKWVGSKEVRRCCGDSAVELIENIILEMKKDGAWNLILEVPWITDIEKTLAVDRAKVA
jgi:hypothetical protein